ncbi:MAG TPA: hypothetical protein PKA31_03930 [Candidatus Moranbacteria bacterium]|nr:hypothetical protein [Candidatus Moranbacteria bacterium]
MEENKQEGMEQEAPKQEDFPAQESSPKGDDVSENKLWALLGYLGVLCLIPLLGRKESAFAQFHAKQGLVLLIGWVVSWFPVFGWVIGVIVLVFSIMGIINVLSGKKEKLPIVGDLAEKINL